MTGPSTDVRLLVLGRDHWLCLRCNASTGLEIHHRCPRRSGGTSALSVNFPENLVSLCVNCHRWVESQRYAAKMAGYLLSTPDRAQAVPLQHCDGWTWYRLVDGRRIFALDREIQQWRDTGSLPEWSE